MPSSSANQQEQIEKQLAKILSKQLKQSAEGRHLVEEYKKDPNAAAEALNNFLRERLISDNDLAEKAVSVLGGNTNRQRNAVRKDSQFETVITDSEIDQIFNIGSLNDLIVKRSFFQDKGQVAVFVLSPLFVLLMVAGVIYYINYLSNLRAQEEALKNHEAALKASQPIPGPDDSFNIVIAQIGDISNGEPITTPDTKRFTLTLCNYIDSEMAMSFSQKVHVDHKNMPILSQSSEAQKLAESLNADLVVYGNVTVQGDQGEFFPRFYVSDRTNDVEVGGYNQLSHPIKFKVNIESDNLLEELQLRAKIYVNYISGLVFLNIRDRDPVTAENYFQQAVNATEQLNYPFEGREVLYLLLAYAQKLGQKYDAALANLETALEINPNYARAYIGLGNVYYHNFINGDRDTALLDLSWDYYQMSLDIPMKPQGEYATSYIEEKANIGFGNILTQRYETSGDLSNLSKAIDRYQSVIDRYNKKSDDTGLQRLAAYAYSGLGWVYNAQGEQKKALEVFQNCKALSTVRALDDVCISDIDHIRNEKTSN